MMLAVFKPASNVESLTGKCILQQVALAGVRLSRPLLALNPLSSMAGYALLAAAAMLAGHRSVVIASLSQRLKQDQQINNA